MGNTNEPEEQEPEVLSLASLQEPEKRSLLLHNKLRLMLVGKTGVGKSSTGNILLGGGDFFHTSCRPHADTQRWKVQAGGLEGRHLILVDTPGLGSPDRGDTAVKEEVISGLEGVAPGPHAFLLVLRVGRFTQEEKTVVEQLQGWFGNRMLRHTVILFTHGDDLDQGMDIWEHINANSNLRELVGLCRNRVHVVDNMYWNEHPNHKDRKVELFLRLLDMKENVAVDPIENLLSAVAQSEVTAGLTADLGETCDSVTTRSRNNRDQIRELIKTVDKMAEENGYYTQAEPCCIL